MVEKGPGHGPDFFTVDVSMLHVGHVSSKRENMFLLFRGVEVELHQVEATTQARQQQKVLEQVIYHTVSGLNCRIGPGGKGRLHTWC